MFDLVQQEMADLMDLYPTTDIVVSPEILNDPLTAGAIDNLMQAYFGLTQIGINEAGVARMMLGIVHNLYEAMDMLPVLPSVLRSFAQHVELQQLAGLLN
ncbi:hypothetical protein GCM10023219_21080 [Stakelama sediminis]|uniref:Uncharacterized protein n=1 Tax=Stakelama sediminis TaxID=463200 RepID=A0A840Z2F2_9SPHN|nr:hypothetical protein [Stakelama sediminis]MBB5719979.1 hypothetical protein [Stakelama sediminis]